MATPQRKQQDERLHQQRVAALRANDAFQAAKATQNLGQDAVLPEPSQIRTEQAKTLVTGPTLTVQGLIDRLEGIEGERNGAGVTRMSALLADFANLTFEQGRPIFTEARAFETKAMQKAVKDGNTELAKKHKSLASRVSECAAIFTALTKGGTPAKAFEGQGYGPAISKAREVLKEKGLTVAGNPRLDDSEREVARAEREQKAKMAEGIKSLPAIDPELPAEEQARIIAEHLAAVSAVVDNKRANAAAPQAFIRICNAVERITGDLQTVVTAEEWTKDNVPTEVLASLEALAHAAYELIEAGNRVFNAEEDKRAKAKAEKEAKAAQTETA